MASSLNGTGITFSDATTLSTQPVTSFIGQTGAVNPTTLGNLGSIVQGYYIVNSPTAGAGSSVATSYATGTTIAGSSIAYNLYGNTQQFGTSTNNTVYASASFQIARSGYTSTASFPTQNAGVGGSNFIYISTGYTSGAPSSANNTCYYTTGLSGSWKSITPFVNLNQQNSCSGLYQIWAPALWIRYA